MTSDAATTAPTANILLVDDRSENLLALEAVLEPLGQRLVRAMSGEEALKHLLTDDFALILLDVQMPGLDGFDTAEHIKSREKTRDIPIIFITAINREPHHAMRGYDTGAVDYIAKPFEPWLLQAKVRAFLELHEKSALLKRQARELARSNAELEEFAYVASHDLQEPLQLVAGFLELLVDRHGEELSGDARDIVRRTTTAVARMDALIHDLLRYAQVGNGATRMHEPVDLQVVLDDVVAQLSGAIADAGAAVEVGALPVVDGNPTLLAQLFQNLLSNALKFRRRDVPREVAVSVERSPDLDDRATWVIAVRDNGVGVAPERADKVFAMFERLHSADEVPGTGIGLAIARKIVERHGGRIWVEPSPGGGATFVFTLPSR
jgi:signal transduction histidine kinase